MLSVEFGWALVGVFFALFLQVLYDCAGDYAKDLAQKKFGSRAALLAKLSVGMTCVLILGLMIVYMTLSSIKFG